MRLRKVSGCDNGTCPAVYLSDRGTAVVQGNLVAAGTEGLVLGNGESAVELPTEVILAAFAALVRSEPTRETLEVIHRELGEVLACS